MILGAYKDLILLTKSKKHSNYCVAGFDYNTKEWVRIITSDEVIHNAVRPVDICYEDGKEAQLFDIIRVQIKGKDNNVLQPENYILDEEYYIQKLGVFNKRDILSLCEDKDCVFFGNSERVTHEDLVKEHTNEIYSLLLIKVDYFIVTVKDYQKETLKANFKYKGNWYNNFSITDIEFTNRYYDEILVSDQGRMKFYNIPIVVSLGELYNQSHYKLIASIVELSDDEYIELDFIS